MTAVLKLENLTKKYGVITAVNEVSLEVQPGARHAIIGPNGAGKSTLFSLLSGGNHLTSGRVQFMGEDISYLSRHKRVARGLAATFQHSSLFSSGTVADNVVLAVQRRLGISRQFATPVWRFKEAESEVREQIAAVGLIHRSDSIVSSLSHGERRQLEIALALATGPKLLLLDEPTAGMSPRESHRFVDLIESLPSSTTIVLVEHDMDVVFRLATHLTVMHLGSKLADGLPGTVADLPEVQAAYLGDASVGDLFDDHTNQQEAAVR